MVGVASFPNTRKPPMQAAPSASPWGGMPSAMPSMAPQPVQSRSGFDPATGMPYRPEFQSILGAGGGLGDPFKAGYKKMTAHTVSDDMNPWLGLQQQKIGQEQASMRDRLSGDVNVGLGTGMSNLAASGGIDSGARERLMAASAAQRTRGLSDINQQASASRLGAGIAAEQMGREAERYNAGALDRGSAFNASAFNNNSQFNAGNAIGGAGMQNAFNADVYGQDMQAWGAGQTAEAQLAAANQENPGLFGMGGFLGSGAGGNKGLLGTGVLGGGRAIDTRGWGF